MPKSLLVADDSLTIRKAIGMVLSTEDCRIIAVDNGLEALAKARELKPDLVLADVVMPGMGGYEVCEAIKSDASTQQIPVILLAGNFEPFDENRARAARADGHLIKPFESEALIQKVQSLLGITAAQPELARAPAPRPLAAVPPPPAPTPSAYRPSLPLQPRGGPPGSVAPPAVLRPSAQPPNVGMAPRPGTPPSGPHAVPSWSGPPTPVPRVPPSRPGMPVGFSRTAANAGPVAHPGQPPRTPMSGTPPWASHPPQAHAPLRPAQPMAAPAFARGPVPQGGPAFGVPIPAPQQRPFAPAIAPHPAHAPDGGEAALRQALANASREVIERIAWEVIPQLAETIVREHLDKLIKDRDKSG
jgi:CheY-like chemotaxis protein